MNGTVGAASVAIALVVLPASKGAAQSVQLGSGSITAFAPGGQPCLVGIRDPVVRAATRVEGDCVFESGALRARVFATSGAGVLPVDVSSEVKVVVAQFEVPVAAGASAVSHVPFHAIVPVSWSGEFFNMTAGPFHATASVNMFLRLREGNATDVNFAGTLISQSRFQGASHGGINQCLTLPTDEVSAAVALIDCGLATVQKDAGVARAELSGVIRTGQVYNLELVIRGDLVSPVVTDPYDAYISERLAFDEDRGLSWRESAIVHIGSDPESSVEGLRQEIAELQAELARLRSDFDGHFHTYLTGQGVGHNAVTATTPPPQLGPTH